MKTTRAILWGMAAMMAVLFLTLYVTSRTATEKIASAPFGAPFQLVSQDNAPVTQEDFKGKPTALFFGFTHCPEICPTTVYELSGWLNAVDPDANGLQAYFVTVDPARDTPAHLKTYLGNITQRIIGISGDPATVEAMVRSFKVYFKKIPSDAQKPDGDYTMDHSASIFLLDRQGRFVGTIAYGENADAAKQKLKNLMKRPS